MADDTPPLADAIAEFDAARCRLRDTLLDCHLSRLEKREIDETLIDLDIAVEAIRKHAQPSLLPTVAGGDETFAALAAEHATLTRMMAAHARSEMWGHDMAVQAERCFTAALEHATSAQARRGESAWEVAARAVAGRQTPVVNDAPIVDGFKVEASGTFGFHTGRPRYRATCGACGEVVHEETTGPASLARYHMRERHGERYTPPVGTPVAQLTHACAACFGFADDHEVSCPASAADVSRVHLDLSDVEEGP